MIQIFFLFSFFFWKDEFLFLVSLPLCIALGGVWQGRQRDCVHIPYIIYTKRCEPVMLLAGSFPISFSVMSLNKGSGPSGSQKRRDRKMKKCVHSQYNHPISLSGCAFVREYLHVVFN